MFYRCTKRFYDDGTNEIIGYFSTYQKAQTCKREGPQYSIDDPDEFTIIIEVVDEIPNSWKYRVNETMWGSW
jgi:hypothetical protein